MSRMSQQEIWVLKQEIRKGVSACLEPLVGLPMSEITAEAVRCLLLRVTEDLFRMGADPVVNLIDWKVTYDESVLSVVMCPKPGLSREDYCSAADFIDNLTLCR